MKKLVAVILVLCMALVLFACGGSSNDNNSSGGGGSSNSGSSNSNDSGGGGSSGGGNSGGGSQSIPPPKEIGFYDRDYDYTQHRQYKFAYMVTGASMYGDIWDQSFAIWADRLNMNYTGMFAPADGTTESFLSGLETYCNMDYDGLIIDGDVNLGGRIDEICREADVLWMFGMAQGRDYSRPFSLMGESQVGNLLAPNVGFNNIIVGEWLADGLMKWKEDTYPEVPWDEVCFISLNFSVVPQLNERTLGSKMRWALKNPSFGTYDPDPTVNLKNFVILDASAAGMDQTASTNLVTQELSNPTYPNIKVWLISGIILDMAMGASIAAENMGMIDNVCSTTFGGLSVIDIWALGEPTTIRFTLETASPVFVEAIINGFWSMLAGYTTPDTLWPEWVNKSDKGDIFKLTSELDPISQYPMVELDANGEPIVLEEHNYASMFLPMNWMTMDNQAEFMGWSYLYEFGPDGPASQDELMYPQFPIGTDINLFSARGVVPDYYDKWPSQK